MEISIIKTEAEYREQCRRLDDFLDQHADELDHLKPEDLDEYKDPRHRPLLWNNVPRLRSAGRKTKIDAGND